MRRTNQDGMGRDCLASVAFCLALLFWLGPQGRRAKGQEAAPILYLRHCAACHGKQGDGLGRAARHVFPKPRNFRRARFRFVTAGNRVASRTDIATIVDHGVPGTAMPAFKKLPAAERKLLVDHVLKLRRDGIRERIRQYMLDSEETVDAALLKKMVSRKITAGTPVAIPMSVEAKAKMLARGKEVYRRQGCKSCHGPRGEGNLGQDLVNDNGFPTRVRDFAIDQLKSGHDPVKMARIIKLGMPGTPMPSSGNLNSDDLLALTAYCLSLGTTPKRRLTNHQRAMLAIGKRPEEVGATRPAQRPK